MPVSFLLGRLLKQVLTPDRAVRVTDAMLITGGTSIRLGIKPKLGTTAILGSRQGFARHA
jgi:hypothetical protein